jgi:peptidoglycan/LPS O-acetylase OafA/YrhL
MDPLSPVPVMAALFLAFSTSFLLVKRFGAPTAQGRFASIDGLRGYLAFCVFLHHSSVWYFYLRTGQWKVPPSNLYTHLGQASVALFFMITGFLFFSKIIDSRTKRVDWLKLYVSRFLRLTPLYCLLIFLLFVVVAFLSRGKLNEPLSDLGIQALRWLGFTIFGDPDINGIARTSTIVGGLTWSLAYEWLFYLSLPLLSLVVGVIPPLRYILLAVAVMTAALLKYPSMLFMVIFFGGMAAAVLVRNQAFCRLVSTRIASFIAIACVCAAVILSPSAYKIVPLALLAAAFTIIACGNNIFGALTNPISRALGELAYSIYLLHGITLFVLFTFIVGIPEAKALSPLNHWMIVLGIVPVLILVCFTTFHFIERPGMRSAERVTTWLRSGWRRSPAADPAIH